MKLYLIAPIRSNEHNPVLATDGYGLQYLWRNFSITKKTPLLFITTHLEQTDIDSETI